MKHTRAIRRWVFLAAMLALPASSAWAQSVVTNATYNAESDGDVTIVLATEGGTPTVSVFATESPARIVLDMAATSSSVASAPVSVGSGAVQSFQTLAAGDRTRLVVDLSRMTSYDYQAEGGTVTLTVAGSGSTARAASAGGRFEVQAIDFRRGEAGQSRVILTMNREGANVAVDNRNGRIVADIFDARLPERLDQRIDVVDFATPVQMIDVTPRGDSVRLDMEVKGEVRHLAYQSGSDVIIEVSEPTYETEAEPEVQFYEDKEYSGSRVTFNFQDIPVRSVLQLIADVSDLNIVVADNVAGNLTLRLTNVPWDQALDIVLDARNLDMRRNGNVIWIAPTAVIAQREQQLLQAQQDRKELEPLVTALIDVSYSAASDLQALIQESSQLGGEEGEGLLSPRGQVTYDERTNTLIVTDTADRVAEIRNLVTELDRPVKQVQIESRIVIANSDFAHELGVRFGVTALHDGSNILAIAGDGAGADLLNPATNPRDDGLIDIPGIPQRYNVNLPATDPSAASIGLSFLTGDWLLDLELSALESDGEGEVISTPRIVTANQAEAFIQQGVEIPYEEATSSGATSVQFKEAVLELKVTPLITPDDRIQLDLGIKQDTVGEIYQTARGGTVPSIDTRELETSVLVNNGETIVLGGIFQDERNRSRDKVPFLGDIPGLGYLFKRNSNETRKRELLIFVTPTIVEDRPSVN